MRSIRFGQPTRTSRSRPSSINLSQIGASALHYSPSSTSPEPRPLLLNCYSAADAKAYTPHPDPSAHAYETVRGRPARWARHDPRPCQIPPDWSGGYTSIFAAQAGEETITT